MKKSDVIIVVALGVLLLLPFASAGFFDWITGKASTQPTNLSIPVGNTGPKIFAVTTASGSNTIIDTPNEQSYTDVQIMVQAYDHDNSTDLDDSTLTVDFTKALETTRSAAYGTGCSISSSADKYRNYSCTIRMWYWDRAGTWNIAATIADLSANSTSNTTQVFTYNTLLAFKINPNLLVWNTLQIGDTDKKAINNPTYLNNTGNNLANVTVNATDLAGIINPALYIDANDFKDSGIDECIGTSLNTGAFVPINTNDTSGITLALTKGNLSALAGQQTLYHCLTVVNETLIKQNYTTSTNGAWTIQIVQSPA